MIYKIVHNIKVVPKIEVERVLTREQYKRFIEFISGQTCIDEKGQICFYAHNFDRFLINEKIYI